MTDEHAVQGEGQLSGEELAPDHDPLDVDRLLSEASDGLEQVEALDAPSYQWPQLQGTPHTGRKASLDLLGDVQLDLRIELGRTQMRLHDVLQLEKGSVVPLDRLAGDPVDIYVNGRLVARGEVLVLNDNFCVRVAELVSSEPSAR